MSPRRNVDNQPIRADKKDGGAKPSLASRLLKLFWLVLVTAVVFFIYRYLLVQEYFKLGIAIYMAVSAAVILTYVIYNRGFSRKGITPEMLPPEMSEEEKLEFIEDGERRLRRSRPLLVLTIAFAFTFAVDLIELFAIPLVEKILERL